MESPDQAGTLRGDGAGSDVLSFRMQDAGCRRSARLPEGAEPDAFLAEVADGRPSDLSLCVSPLGCLRCKATQALR